VAGVSLDLLAAVYADAKREKADRKKAMDAVVSLLIERAQLRGAILAIIAADDADRPLAIHDAAVLLSDGGDS